MMLCKESHHHDHRASIALSKWVYLPDGRKQARDLVHELLPCKVRPGGRLDTLKRGNQVSGDIRIIAVPDTATGQQTFPFFDVDDTVLTGPIIEVSKQEAVDLT